MSVRFVIGRAGSGKTARCFNSIVESLRADPLGPPIYWILPKQATFQAERQLTCATDLGGFCRARILSFDLLGREVLADCGGCAIAEVTDLGRQMVIGHLLRKHQPQLQFFASAAHRAGLAAELDDTFGEIERSGKTVADLLSAIDDLQTTGPADIETRALLAKLRDLHLLYDAYATFLGQERLDPHRRATQVLACIERCSLFGSAVVYVDGFYQFTDFERRMLAVLGKIARRVEITLLIDPDSPVVQNPHLQPDELSLFRTTEETYRRLWFTFQENHVAVDEPIVLKSVMRFANPTLAELEKGLFSASRKPAKQSSGVELIEACDRRAEVDAAARTIRKLTHNGHRLRDLGVFLRDLEDYHELINASFREHDIPYFVDRRRAAAHHPLLQFTRNAFLVAQQNWAHVPMMTILKTGLAGLSLGEADELENYVLLHRIRGDIWARERPWEFRRELTAESEDDEPGSAEWIELDRINDLRDRVVGRLRPFVQAIQAKDQLTVREIIVELFDLFERSDIRRTIIGWISKAEAEGKLEQRGEHEQVWTELVELFDQMVDLLGDEPVTLADFLEVLDSGLDRFDLALTPPTVDQVIVGQIDRTRSPQLKAAILLGVNEGVFPRLARPDSILSDGERRVLRDKSIEIEPDTERRLLNENLFGYVAFTRASEQLFITRSMSDDAGRPMGPSPFWRRVVQLCPDAPIDTIPRDQQLAPPRIGTPRQLVTSLMHWVRNLGAGARVEETGDWPALYEWLATHECCDDMIDVMRFRAWKALSYQNAAELSESVAAELFRSPLHASVSRIETFATCPFKHFVRYGLQLRQREAEEVTALDLGNIYHQILERLVRQMLHSRQDWAELPPSAADETIRTCAQDVGKALRGELMLSNARNKYLLSRIEKTLGQVVAGQRAAAERNHLKPAFAELGFGVGQGKPNLPAFSVKTPRGKELLLHGQIDRVDLVEESAQFAIYDYKLTGNTLSLDRVYYGISLQLLTYLLVLQANGQELVGRPITPVAAFYLRLLRKLESVSHPSDAVQPDDEKFDLQVKPRGIFNADHVQVLDGNLSTGISDVIACRINKDGRFGNRNSSDVAENAEFQALLEHVRKRIGELGDQIIAGQVGVTPYRINRKTPCPICEFRAVCRFDVAVNHYTILPGMKREEVLQRVTEDHHVA